jgi:hypothetical protein
VNIADGFVVLNGLIPGRCLRVDIKAINAQNTVLSSISFLDPFARVTCGCPSSFLDELAATEPTGAPSSLILTQVCSF